jgi:hypothetical protein
MFLRDPKDGHPGGPEFTARSWEDFIGEAKLSYDAAGSPDQARELKVTKLQTSGVRPR